MILTVTLNTAIDKTVNVPALKRDDVVRATSIEMYGGGKGVNVARSLHSLGYTEVIATGLQGGHSGRMVTELIEAEGIHTDFVFCRQPTRTSLLIHETDLDSYSAIYEPGIQVYPDEVDQFRAKFSELIKRVQLCIISGSVPCRDLENIYPELIAEAQRAGVTAMLDAHGKELRRGIEARPYLVKPNWEEMCELIGVKGPAMSIEPVEAVRQVLDLGVPFVAISLGAEGAIGGMRGDLWRVRVPPVKSVNAVGSGDAMMAGMAIAHLQGKDVRDTLRLGVAAGTANCMTWGAGTFRQEHVDLMLEQIVVERIE